VKPTVPPPIDRSRPEYRYQILKTLDDFSVGEEIRPVAVLVSQACDVPSEDARLHPIKQDEDAVSEGDLLGKVHTSPEDPTSPTPPPEGNHLRAVGRR
jgi:hypothetical protein